MLPDGFVTLPCREREVSAPQELLGSCDCSPPRVEMPLPSELSTVFLGGLFLLALLAALYVAREIILPVVLAFILHLLLAPALRMLERLRAPRMLATVLLIGLLFGTACRARSRDARRSRT